MPAAPEKKVQPIVVKRIKKVAGHGGHGGAWKIAYADFVTAMMAFFLLMWLLGSTTKGDLQGIADYFSSPLKVALSGGRGSGDSSSLIDGGGADLTRTVGQVRRGDVESQNRNINLQAFKAEQARRERQELLALSKRVEQMLLSNPRLAEFRSQIRLELTPDGLRIQIVDEQNRPMYDTGSAIVKDYMRELLRSIGKVLNDVPNRITISGHTDSAQYGSGERGYSNWELSSDRANAARRELVAGGMQEAKVLRVLGLASALPLDAEHPEAAINRRISLIVMNAEAVERTLRSDRIELPADADAAQAAGTVQQAADQPPADAKPASPPIAPISIPGTLR
ncbi:MAG: flagellar motor protein MotB [Burkholderiaceae bacterium]